MGVTEGIDENPARFGSHRAHRSGLLAFPLDDLAASVGRWRRPGNDNDPIRYVFRGPVGKLYLQSGTTDRDALDGGAKVGAGIEGAWAGRRADCGAVYGGVGTVRHATDDLRFDRTRATIRGRGASQRLDDLSFELLCWDTGDG